MENSKLDKTAVAVHVQMVEGEPRLATSLVGKMPAAMREGVPHDAHRFTSSDAVVDDAALLMHATMLAMTHRDDEVSVPVRWLAAMFALQTMVDDDANTQKLRALRGAAALMGTIKLATALGVAIEAVDQPDGSLLMQVEVDPGVARHGSELLPAIKSEAELLMYGLLTSVCEVEVHEGRRTAPVNAPAPATPQ